MSEPHQQKNGPSAHPRRVRCPGSMAAEAQFPDNETIFTAEETAAHALAEKILTTEGVECSDFIGQPMYSAMIDGTLQRFYVDSDMASSVQTYVDAIRRESAVPDAVVMIEQQISYHSYDPGGFGTLDAAIYDPATKHLGIDDLEYGREVKVDAKDNESLMTYALAWIDTFSDIVGEVIEVTIRIHQPRLNHCDEYTYTIDEILQHGRILRGVMKICRDENAPRIAGEKQCTFCRARQTCDEHAKWQLSTVKSPKGLEDRDVLISTIILRHNT